MAAEFFIGAEEARDSDLLHGVCSAVGHAVIMEEAGIVGLAAGDGRGVYERDALRRGLCA